MEGAWEVFDAMRTGQIPEHRPDGKHIVPVEPDAVTFTAMIMACAYRDDFEQSRALLEMRRIVIPACTQAIVVFNAPEAVQMFFVKDKMQLE